MNDPAQPPSSAAAHAQQAPIPPSRQPSVASRGSRGSLRRQDGQSSSASPQPQDQPPQSAQPTPPPQPPAEPREQSFSPLFALLTSTSHPSQKPTLHHPSVHYIFADDDPEILTEALARHHLTPEELEGEDPESDQAGQQEGRRDAPNDRAILLDLTSGPSGPGGGLQVSWASSLTPDWAVVGARVSGRVDDDDGLSPQPQRDAEGTGSLILRVEGVAVEAAPPGTVPPGAPPGKGPGSLEGGEPQPGANRPQQHQRSPSDEYPGLIEEFERRMGVMRRVVDTGEERRRKTEADAPAVEDAQEGGVVGNVGDGEEGARRQSGSD